MPNDTEVLYTFNAGDGEASYTGDEAKGKIEQATGAPCVVIGAVREDNGVTEEGCQIGQPSSG